MLNHYSLFRYIMLLITILVGIVYALPNIYGEDPSVQITGTKGQPATEPMLIKIRDILEKHHIKSKSIALEHNTVLVRFADSQLQLRARETLINTLDKNHILTLNLVPATPEWLYKLWARPIKLGLDLRGGVYFLMKVDIDSIIDKIQDKVISEIHRDLRDEGIPYITINKTKNYGIGIRLYNNKSQDQTILWLKKHYLNLNINRYGDKEIKATLKNDSIMRAREFAVQQNIIIIRKRVNKLGISDPLVQRQGSNHIVVELPGIQDMARAKEILEATANLEFRLVNNLLGSKISYKSYIPEDSEIKTTREGQLVGLYKQVILTGDHITDSYSSLDEYHRPQVTIYLDRTGGKIISQFTQNNIGKLMATLFIEYKDEGKKDANGHPILIKQEEIINLATIQSRLGNNFRITGINDLNEARRLSILLRSGALIAPVQIEEEHSIGPTLGMQNINQGLQACLCALSASILFMLAWYRKFGLIATAALLVNLVLIVGIMSLIPGATLTMPGIAGIVLTLAVAVDANVLINERIKEELQNGCNVQRAIHEGYHGAFSSIIDANINTLIVAIILYNIGSDSIKGFAITTAIGIVTSLFTSIIGTRAIVNLVYGNRRIKKLSI